MRELHQYEELQPLQLRRFPEPAPAASLTAGDGACAADDAPC